MHLTLKEIKRGYRILKEDAFRAYHEGDMAGAKKAIEKAADFVQQFNWIYTDTELEDLLQKISEKEIIKTESFQAIKGRVAIYDDWCTSYVLVLQYVEALSLYYDEVLYITSKDVDSMQIPDILDDLKKFSNVKTLVIKNQGNSFKQEQEIYSAIVEFGTTKLFLHKGYKSPVVLPLYSLPTEIDRYLINLSDQTFWLGAKGIDYSLEFRPFGATVSIERRGLKPEQLLYVPFYPVTDGNPFQGFPKEADGKVVIFSGGDFYKTLDPDFSYWDLVKSILNENPEVVFLFATKNIMGKTNQFLEKFIAENSFESRFIPIGFRPDIYEVIGHADIFMGTTPVCGSLISQLAASNKKPILQYYLPNTYDDETEQAINHNAELKISYSNKAAFLEEAKKLIESEKCRKEKGDANWEAMFKKEQFEKRLIEVVERNESTPPFKYVNFSEVLERWWWSEKLGFYNTTQYLFALVGKKRVLRAIPSIAVKYYTEKLKNKFTQVKK